jgi:hypothetical protein
MSERGKMQPKSAEQFYYQADWRPRRLWSDDELTYACEFAEAYAAELRAEIERLREELKKRA